jgi:hypothetical protein
MPAWELTSGIFASVFIVCAVFGNVRWTLAARGRAALARWVVPLASDLLASGTIVFAVAFAVFSLPLLIGGPLPPSAHDEFGNLLGADTFLHGRLTNPTPAHWRFFQTIHELLWPTYASKFPPGEGLFLAAGRLMHLPHAGTTGVMALACVVIGRVMRMWMPPLHALLGALVAATMPLMLIWAGGYWGPGPTALGCGLLLLGVGDVIRPRHASATIRRRVMRGLMMAAGLTILANTRPLEGLIASVLIGVWCAVVAWRRPIVRRVLVSTVVWAMPWGGAATGWMMYYDWRVTGHALLLPYALHVQEYMGTPLLRWQEGAPEGLLRHTLPRLERFHGQFEPAEFVRENDWAGFWLNTRGKFAYVASAVFVIIPTALPLALLPLVYLPARRRGLLMAAVIPPLLVAVLLLPIQITQTRYFRLHYFAPAIVPLLLAIGLATHIVGRSMPGMRRVRLAVPIFCGLIVSSLWTCYGLARAATEPSMTRFGTYRVDLVSTICASDQRSLVLVSEGPDFDTLTEFVYNDADIPNSPVVFVHSIDPQSDAMLVKAFPDRTVWRLQCTMMGVQLMREPTTQPTTQR